MQPVAAQQGIRTTVAVDSSRILIGGRMELTYQFTVPAGQSITMPPIDSATHFEVIGQPRMDTVANGSENIITARYTLTSFDSGHWVIPPFAVAAGVQTDSVPVDIVFSDFNPAQPYHSISGPEAVPEPIARRNWWYYIAGGLLILGILLYIFLRKKPKPVAVPVKEAVKVNPYTRAMEQLARLQLEKSAPKKYYTALTDIFREYTSDRTGIRSVQETTGELVQQLNKGLMPADVYQSLAQTLQLCDSVKFAKYIPANDEAAATTEHIKAAIVAVERNFQTGEQKK